jgi:hypothetical protein
VVLVLVMVHCNCKRTSARKQASKQGRKERRKGKAGYSPRHPQWPSPRQVRKKAYLPGRAAVLTWKTGSALAYCVVMAALLWRSPTSGPWRRSATAVLLLLMLRCCSCKHKSKTHRRLGLPLARQLLQTGHVLVRSQIRVRHGDAVRVGVAMAVVMELLAVVMVMVVVMRVVLGATAAVLVRVRVLMVLVLLVASVLWVLGVVVKACGNQDRGAHW